MQEDPNKRVLLWSRLEYNKIDEGTQRRDRLLSPLSLSFSSVIKKNMGEDRSPTSQTVFFPHPMKKEKRKKKIMARKKKKKRPSWCEYFCALFCEAGGKRREVQVPTSARYLPPSVLFFFFCAALPTPPQSFPSPVSSS